MIAMVCGAADPRHDGVADYCRALVAALGEAGEEIELVPVEGSPRRVLCAAAGLRERRPDLVHVQFAPSAFGFAPWPGLLPDLVAAPVVTTLHEYGWWAVPRRMPHGAWRAFERRGIFDRETWRLVPRSAALVTTNAGHAGVLERRFGRHAERIPLAPNVGVCSSTPRDATRARLGVPADAEVVTFFGFVHPVKGLRYLIGALAALRAAGRHRLHLLIVGGFTSLALPESEARAFRAELADVVSAHGVHEHVTVTGHLPAQEVSAALRASDLAAFPFTAGATTKSGALLSAFAHGLPTVVTAADPPDLELVDGRTVVVAPRVRNADALAGALARLLDDPGLRDRVAAGGAALAEQRSWPRIAEAHRTLYDRVLERSRA